jgi:hypothetical protein
MPLQKIQFRPGVNREGTNYSNEGGWYECDKIRFRSGFPEKIGGWIRATGEYFYRGVCRALINWIDNDNNNLIGIGTHLKYYINSGLGLYNDVTPLRLTRATTNTPPDALSNPFSCTSGSAIITVTDTGNGAQEQDFVTFSGATAFGGFATTDINKNFQIVRIINANTYEIVANTVATSTVAAGGGATVNAYYEITTGLAIYTTGNGFGAGVWNGTITTTQTTLTYTSGTGLILLNSSSTTINVTSTAGFTAAGIILINSEVITYTGVTGTSFTGCVRGTNQSMAENHALDPVAPVATPAPITVSQVTSFAGTTGWGLGSDVSTGGVGQQLRLWTHDNFGEDLLLAPRGTTLYYWVNNTSTYPRAVTLEEAATIPVGAGAAQFVPKATNQVIISDVSRFVITMGSNSYNPDDPDTDFDPMLVRWSDQEDPFTWIPAITNQAGEQRLTNGSFIMQAKRNRQEILIWTDAALYSMQYLGPPYVYGFTLLMDNISIMSPNSAIVVNNVAYWMGIDKFYSYSGVVATLPCSVRQYVYNDISFAQRFQILSGTNEGYNEVWWYYVSNTEVALAAQESRSPVPDRYVIYNHLERVWYYGDLRRTFWLDSPLQASPMAAQGLIDGAINEDKYHTSIEYGTLLFQEVGVDDVSTASTAPFTAYIQSSDFDVGDGHNFGFVWRIIPDITFTGSNAGLPKVTMELKPRQFSGSPYGTADIDTVQSTLPYTPIVKQYNVEQYTPQVYTRVRARQMAFKIESSGQTGVAWQLGSPRIDIREDGRR